jgi:hypothetical protein
MILQGSTKVDDSQKPPNFLKNLLQRTSKQGRRERGREREGAGVKETEGLRCRVQGSGRKDGGAVLLPFSVSSPFQALCGLWERTTLVCF